MSLYKNALETFISVKYTYIFQIYQYFFMTVHRDKNICNFNEPAQLNKFEQFTRHLLEMAGVKSKFAKKNNSLIAVSAGRDLRVFVDKRQYLSKTRLILQILQELVGSFKAFIVANSPYQTLSKPMRPPDEAYLQQYWQQSQRLSQYVRSYFYWETGLMDKLPGCRAMHRTIEQLTTVLKEDILLKCHLKSA